MSPDNKSAAVVFSRNCGATTAENTQISIVDSNMMPDGPGNVLIFDKANIGGDSDNIKWLSGHNIIISVPKSARIFYKKNFMNGVNVNFQLR